MNIVENHNKVNVEYQNTVTHSIECRSNKSEFQRNDWMTEILGWIHFAVAAS